MSTDAPPSNSVAAEPSEADWKFANALYARFRPKPGSKQIATAMALAYLSALLHRQKPRIVLEMGAGIGTITEALLTHPCGIQRIVTTEDNAFCLSVLPGNLTNPRDPRLTLTTKVSEVPADLTFDMVVGDGGFKEADDRYVTFWQQLKVGTVFFAEGHRTRLRTQLAGELSASGLTLNLDPYGTFVVRKWRPSTRLAALGIRIPLPLKKVRRGCWIGAVT